MSSTTEESKVGRASAGIGDAAATVQEKAGEMKQQGRGKLGEELDRRTSDVGGQARQAAHALRRSGEQMREEGGQPGSEQMAGLFETAAARVERLGGYLERASGDRMLRDVEDFARRRPWAVAGAGLVAGLAASRVLKASSERRYATGPRGTAGDHGYRTSGRARTPYGTTPEPPATYGSPGPSYGTPGQGGSVAGVT